MIEKRFHQLTLECHCMWCSKGVSKPSLADRAARPAISHNRKGPIQTQNCLLCYKVMQKNPQIQVSYSQHQYLLMLIFFFSTMLSAMGTEILCILVRLNMSDVNLYPSSFNVNS